MRHPLCSVLVLALLVSCRGHREVVPLVESSAEPVASAPADEQPELPKSFGLRERGSLGVAEGNTRAVTLADVDGDGAADVLLGRFRGADVLLLNDGRGGLWPADAGSLSAERSPSFDLLVGDLTGDGRADVFVLLSDDEPNQLHRQRADGPLFERQDGGAATSGRAKSHAGALADLDHDGDLDLLVANRDGANERLDNDGGGVFTLAASDPLGEGQGNSRDVLVGDLDGDQWDDVVVVNGADQPEDLLRNDGAGALLRVGEGALVSTPGKSAAGALGDVDGDGDLDLLIVQRKDADSRLWLNDGAAGFALAAMQPAAGGNSSACLLVDLDGDAALDVVVVDRDAAPRLLQGDGAGGFAAFADLEVPVLDGTCVAAAGLAPGSVTLLLGVAGGADERWRLGR